MPTEKDLRDSFARAEAPNSLDARRIVSRSRARRLPRQLAAGSAGALALVGVVVLGVQVTQFSSPATMTAGGAYDSSESAPAPDADTMIKRAPADKVNLCEGPLAELAPSQYGLQLDVTFAASAPAASDLVTGTVQLTNTSDSEVIGYTPTSPAMTLSRDGVVLWHSNGITNFALMHVDLAPGASLEYQASFAPVRCSVEDDMQDAFREDLPALEPGSYQLSALIDFTPALTDMTTPDLDLVPGPLSNIRLE